MAVSHNAERGLVALSLPGHRGGTKDILRATKLASSKTRNLRHFADEFFPTEARGNLFQPEPGCSDATFVGSAADMAGLASMMLNCVAEELSSVSGATGIAHLVVQPHIIPQLRRGQRPYARLELAATKVLNEQCAGYEVRLSGDAVRQLHAQINEPPTHYQEGSETGGLLFGERDDSIGVIWIDEVSGPPPDSKASPRKFLCGIRGTGATNRRLKKSSRLSTAFVGMWHTHPSSLPTPSKVDVEGMLWLVGDEEFTSPKSLLLIVSTMTSDWLCGAYLFSRRMILDTCAATVEPTGVRGITEVKERDR
jgi:integrative and conjugative element protein (TIGR02256 family)